MKNLRFLCILFLGLTVISAFGIQLFAPKAAIRPDIKPGVVSSFYPMYIAAAYLLQDVDTVWLSNLSEPQTGCLHDYTLTTGDMKTLSKASAFVINGGGIEPFLDDVTAAYPDLTIIDAGRDLTGLSEEPGSYEAMEDRSEHNHAEDAAIHGEPESESAHGHEHHHHESEENAHYWMSIPCYEKQVRAIRDGLTALLSHNRSSVKQIQSNAAAYLRKLDVLRDEQKSLRQVLSGRNVILFHEAYEYVAADYGMNTVYLLDLDEERQVSAGEVADVIRIISEKNVSLILAEPKYGREMGELVSSQTGATVLYLDTIVRGKKTDQANAYLKRMRHNIDLLRNGQTE